MKIVLLFLAMAAVSFAQCGRMVVNPSTGKLDCIGSTASGVSFSASTGSGAPTANCTAPTVSLVYVYIDTANLDEWWCAATNTWKKFLSVTGTGPFAMVGSSAPFSSGSSASQPLCTSNLYYLQTDTGYLEVCNGSTWSSALNQSGTIACIFNSTADSFQCYDPTGALINSGGGGGSSLKGTATLGMSAIASGACASPVTVAATGVLTTDTVAASFSSDPTGVTGFSAPNMLTVIPYPTSGNVNFRVCNNTGSGITPGSALVVNWAVGARTVASGTAALGTSLIASGACASAVTVAASGVTTANVVSSSFNGDPTAIAGYSPSTGGMLSIVSYPTSGNVNFKVCNNTGSGITPGAATLNWQAY